MSYNRGRGPLPRPPLRAGRRRSSGGVGDLAAGAGDFIRERGGWVLLALVLGVTLLAGYILFTLRDLPDPGKQDVLAHSLSIYDRKHRLIEQRDSQGQFHVVLKLADMGKPGPQAMLAAEDRNFYHEGAVNLGSTARAFYEDLAHHGYVQGGSTITQQLIKIQLLTPQKSIFRKLQEVVLAIGLESRYSKDQVLEMYLNRVYYGHNAYGLGAATQTYFGKDKKPSELTVAQAAFLAGLVNAPTYYDPQTHFERAKARQLYVLRGMVATHALSQAEADAAAQEDIQKQLKFDTAVRRSKAPHFVDYVLGKLEQQAGSAAIQQGGFEIDTTLDLDLQDLATRAVQDGTRSLAREGVNNGMLLAAKPDSGEILAWVGSADYYDEQIGGQFDVILSQRQPGSSFKPYVFEAALKDRKITLASTLDDKATDFGGGYRPKDFDDRFMGPMSARTALVLSRNVPAVAVGQKEGMNNVNNLAHTMGVKSELKDIPSGAIGANEITMFEHLQGYQTFANQGSKMPLFGILKISDTSGNVLFQETAGQQDGRQQVLSAAEAYLVTDVLKDYNKQWNLGWNRQMAGKSGTTGGDQTGIHKDAWMMAYSPNIVVGAWAGNTSTNGSGKSISSFGTEVGQSTLATFINGLPAGYKDWYRQPDGIVEGKGCPGNKDAASEIFLTGTQGSAGCTSPSPSPSPSASPSQSPTSQPTIAPPQGTPTPIPVTSVIPTILPPRSPAPSPKPT